MKNYSVDLKGISDNRGLLVSLESFKNVPFEIKRVYYLCKLDSQAPRGFHAHKNLKQLVVCVSGSCDFLLDDGKEKIQITLNDPTKALFIESMIWREMHNFSKDCVVMVLASEHYDETDYIRDYEVFKIKAAK
ncbi:sugar 3,4-ketoisomerase [Peredibacter starrii]|uniref:FdtA/QdtA family cupin domain-containing protein n=1 Tax=Peredibacter starrii TaxID=28202 RepID=A0AAX4HR50_9BACT|nr:FdtA/QdtA family cupin domain-containing protein [Peredibacter starrii]WPU65824.1 FdtA/QdtA family cupin domain-containing protein [Peredibacter starrii]